MMSVLSYPGLSDAVKKQMVRKVAEMLRSKATLLVGWFAFDEGKRRVEKERTLTQLDHLEKLGYELSILAEGIEPTNAWRNLKRHEWRAYRITPDKEGSLSSPISSSDLVKGAPYRPTRAERTQYTPDRYPALTFDWADLIEGRIIPHGKSFRGHGHSETAFVIVPGLFCQCSSAEGRHYR